jgi:signal transduction histidine kinase
METVRVLYAEDDPADGDLTRAYFEGNAPGIDLDVVATGEECLVRIEGGGYDALLLDNQLPDMEGTEVLRQLSRRAVSLPVVMVTGVGDEGLAIQVLRLGAWDYVPKDGAYRTRLPRVLENAIAAHRHREGRRETVRPGPYRILYIEHDPADVDLTRRYFAEAAAHLDLTVINSGSAALDRLAVPGAFDLVLADLRLPVMHALDLLREARGRGLGVPFIIITGRGDEQAAVAALKLGAYDYIVKGENYLLQLPHAIENAIARSELSRANQQLEAELARRELLAIDNAKLFEGAQQALRTRDEFLAIAAHEIRGPLTALRLAAQSLYTRKVPADMVPAVLDIIEREDRKLAQFVDELLDLGRIRAGTLQFTFEPVDLGDVVRDVVARLAGDLRHSGSVVSIASQGELLGEWDRSRLDQVVTNLLSNAIKFGLGRPIDISLAGDDGEVTLRLTDRGSGIPPSIRDQIFEPFERELSVRNYGGMGLGLYIVRTIVAGLEGRMSVESAPGAGSTFVVTLPRARHA